jgi:hypothetical protein
MVFEFSPFRVFKPHSIVIIAARFSSGILERTKPFGSCGVMSPFGRIESMSARDYAGIHGKRKRAHQTYRARHRHSTHAFFSIKSLRQGTVAQAATQRVLADWALRNPITGIAGCCARAVSGHAAAAPPSPAMSSRRRISRLPQQADSLSRARLHVNGLPRTTNEPSPHPTSPGQRSRSRTDQETTAHPRPASLSPPEIREPVCVQSACVAQLFPCALRPRIFRFSCCVMR